MGWAFPVVLAVILISAGVEMAYGIVLGVSVIPVIIFAVSLGVNSDQEKRTRVLMLLPRNVKQIGIAQIITFLIFMGGMILILCLISILAPTESFSSALIRILTLFFTLINWIFFFWAYGDLAQKGGRHLRVIYTAAVMLVLALTALVRLEYGVTLLMLPRWSGDAQVLLPELLGTLGLAVGLIITEYNFFIRRKSYLV